MSCFKASTFILEFTTTLNFLRAADWTWGFIDDSIIKMCRDLSKELCKENLSSISQWVLIVDMSETMWSKGGVDSISTLGAPLEVEYRWSPWEHALRACVMLDFNSHLPASIPVITVKGGLDRTFRLKVRYRSIPLAYIICSYFGYMNSICYVVIKGPVAPTRPIQEATTINRQLKGCRRPAITSSEEVDVRRKILLMNLGQRHSSTSMGEEIGSTSIAASLAVSLGPNHPLHACSHQRSVLQELLTSGSMKFNFQLALSLHGGVF